MRSVNHPIVPIEVDESRFLIAHCVKRSYYLQFAKCKSPDCTHCSTRPVKAVNFMKDLDRLGGSIPPPMESIVHRKCALHPTASYAYLDEVLVESRLGRVSHVESAQPSFRHGYLKSCPEGCNVILTSTDDLSRHYHLMGHKATKPTMAKRPRGKKRALDSC